MSTILEEYDKKNPVPFPVIFPRLSNSNGTTKFMEAYVYLLYNLEKKNIERKDRHSNLQNYKNAIEYE